jgi:hypothetical protein
MGFIAVWTQVKSLKWADKTAAQLFAVVVHDRFNSREKGNMSLQLVEGWEVMKLRKCALHLVVCPRAHVNVDLKIMHMDSVHCGCIQPPFYGFKIRN